MKINLCATKGWLANQSIVWILLIVLVSFAACTEKSKDGASPIIKETEPLPTATAKIETKDEFFNLLHKINTMTDKELNGWEKSRNFTSFRTIWKKAQAEWDSLRTDTEEAAFVEKYSDILEVKDKEIRPLIRDPFYQLICNRDGIFATPGSLTRIHRDYCLNDSTGNYSKLKSQEVKSNNNAVRYSQAENMPMNSTKLEPIEAIHDRGVEITKDDWKGCWGASRRLCFSVHITNFIFYYQDKIDKSRTVSFQHRARLYATTYKIKRRCNWVAYQTKISFRNVKVNYFELVQHGSWHTPVFRHESRGINYPDKTGFTATSNSLDYSINLTDLIEVRQSYFNNKQNSHVRNPISVNGVAEATSKELGGYWISLKFR